MKWKTQELYFRQLLASMVGIPLLGKIFFVFPEGSSTSLYEEWLRTEMDIPAELCFPGALGPLNAFNEASANRNDVVCVFPGAYDLTASLAWDKDNTHLIGMGGPSVASDYSEKNVVIYTDTTEVAETINITGEHCMFKNIGVNNAGNHASNVAAVLVNGYGNWFEDVSFVGNLGGNQLSAVAAASLYIAAAAHNCRWINCVIGEDCWGNRSGVNSGQLRFSSNSQPNGGIFRDCYFRSASVTATVAMVAIPGNGAVGRGWMFERCSFHNTNITTGSTNCNQVFYSNDITGQSGFLMLKDCSARGYDCWQDSDYGKILSNMPQWYSGGGLTSEPLLTFDGSA